ncbi:type II toxin-antitoxin system PemK/MazF family toxin [Sulfurimonas sp. SWIR-19]|nr:type II toxin-antitoxin system PemK/MazF family toxin [Sulfurimonas sp. SWIR-19]UCM99273.1 type II toxin-antitoxin system PemK/MazF family toxin [Sulfurimonas sp. SWIR-19]
MISPNEMNVLKTVIVAPMTSKGFEFIFIMSITVYNS